jgi:hypothetical protein
LLTVRKVVGKKEAKAVMKSKRLLFGIVVVLLLVTSVLPGCNEELPPVEADELVIPSSMSPYEVFNKTANAGPQIGSWPFMLWEWTAEDMDPYAMPQGASKGEFIEGFGGVVPELYYTKRDGERVGYGLYTMVVDIAVLKYENTESAERSFINISEVQELQDSTYGSIALKNGSHTLAPWWEELEEFGAEWDESTMPCYLIQSGPFVIYFYGREDVAKDMLDRIIVSFGVESSSNQSQAGNTT